MDYDRLMKFKNTSDSFAPFVGIVVTGVGDGWCEGELALRPQHLNPGGSVHGGCVFSLMDTLGGVAAMAQGNNVTTAGCSVSFLNGAGPKTKKLVGRAQAVKNGRTLLVYDVDVHSEEGLHVAHGTFTLFRLAQPAEY